MNLSDTLHSRLRLPVVGSPMFIASGPELVKAQCRSGIIGAFPTLNARPAAQLRDWLDEVTESNADFSAANPETPAAPFAVNLIVHRSNTRLETDLAEVVAHRVPIVITSLGAREEVNEAVHSYGGVVLHDVINNRFAHKAVEKGADGVIAVAAGAGGHAGALSPFALLQEIRAWFDGPLLLSGAIAHGRSILAALAAGADYAYIGSAFLSTTEANVVADYRQMIVDSSADDVVYSNYFTGVKGNYLRGSIVAAGLDPDNLPEADPTKMDFGTDEKSESKAWKDIWGSGQGIGALTETTSTAALVDRLAAEFAAAREDLLSRVGVVGVG
ncbi:nitronate monooxygenase [Brevibacterium sanguinis]|uniref:Nitronate monooxygenase n=2 Tax=Brevibacterium TaxID=1696 RepID=A0A366IFK7_9MICO|nr:MULTISPECIES: nitronate monooxygenase family protein [Brevibacterium]RBP62427.1 nitronate monooxygenase [Brevibacterium sanguinis]RBP68816.1 nitronate monooxygenase [Brevibacterium celere]